MEDGRPRLLLVDADEIFGQLLRGYFLNKEFDVDYYTCAEDARRGYGLRQYDMCLLDTQLPDDDGVTLIRNFRFKREDFPIMVVTARNAKDDVLAAFRAGVDDYVFKPFNIEELLLRVRALLRRCNTDYCDEDLDTKFSIGRFEFDVVRQVLQFPGAEEVRLTTKESELLWQLVLRKNRLLTRDTALRRVWSESSYFNARSMDVYITKLRKHLRPDPDVEILNVRGRGFKLIC